MLTSLTLLLLLEYFPASTYCPTDTPRPEEVTAMLFDTSGRSGVRWISYGAPVPSGFAEMTAPSLGLSGVAEDTLSISTGSYPLASPLPAGTQHYFRLHHPQFGTYSGAATTCGVLIGEEPRHEPWTPLFVIPFDGSAYGWTVLVRQLDEEEPPRTVFGPSFVMANLSGAPSLGAFAGLMDGPELRNFHVLVEYLPGNSLEGLGTSEFTAPCADSNLQRFTPYSISWCECDLAGDSRSFRVAAPGCSGPVRITTVVDGFEPDVVETTLTVQSESMYIGLLTPVGTAGRVMGPVTPSEAIMQLAIADSLTGTAVPLPQWIDVPSDSGLFLDRNGDGVRDAADLAP